MQYSTKYINAILLVFFLFTVMGFTNINDPDLDVAEEETVAMGTWISDNGNEKFEIYKRGDKYYGKIVWTNHKERLGFALLDEHNPDPSKRDKPIIGLEILTDFVYKGKGVYTHGKVYDPGSGHTYKCKIKAEGNTAKVRGYIFVPLLGRTETAHRIID